MTALSHPNIVRLEGYYFENRPDVTIEQNTQGQYLNLVMEYVQNTLADLII
jgi:serine/threonine protein kinase